MKKMIIIIGAAILFSISSMAASCTDTIYFEDKMHEMLNKGRDYTLDFMNIFYETCQETSKKQERTGVNDLFCRCFSECLVRKIDISNGYPATLTNFDDEKLIEKERQKMLNSCGNICKK